MQTHNPDGTITLPFKGLRTLCSLMLFGALGVTVSLLLYGIFA